MSRARVLVLFLTLAAAGLVGASPSRAALLAQAPRVVLVTILAHLTARGLSRFVLGYPSQRGGVYPPRTGRIILLGACALVMLLLADSIERPWLADTGRVLVLAAAGVAMARGCRSSEASPMYLATALVLLSAAWAGAFGGVPQAARVMMRIPQDAAVLWAAWHVAAIRGRSRDG